MWKCQEIAQWKSEKSLASIFFNIKVSINGQPQNSNLNQPSNDLPTSA